MNMTLVFGLGASGSLRKHLKLGLGGAGVCTSKEKFWEMAQASLLQQAGLSHLPEFVL